MKKKWEERRNSVDLVVLVECAHKCYASVFVCLIGVWWSSVFPRELGLASLWLFFLVFCVVFTFCCTSLLSYDKSVELRHEYISFTHYASYCAYICCVLMAIVVLHNAHGCC